jgi:hypothetical protein
MRMIKKVVIVGDGSLMVIIDKDIINKMEIKKGDRLVVDVVKKLKEGE